MTDRTIQPHKGGRSERLEARLTPAERDLIDRARRTLSFADWCVDRAKEQLAEKPTET